ncbi:MAG: hydrogenase maturation peptidase HycI [Candidatus Omnitrophica bacterium]|nr:hydrogenase maturation peptidase HycI [Candidatus Omnitrophota bacterium]MBU4488563.1 hydrogenase maturation peptidase HycI [Candidatus Omnitrophota bacterium]MCG2705438.1 hydrogenase maturation peptidase HycI [Candidatus Omnitrophota bacterium]
MSGKRGIAVLAVENLKKELSNRLSGIKRVAVLGIGSQLKGDDAAGIIAAMRLKELIAKKSLSRDVEIFIGGTAPENITSEIKRFGPSAIIIIDSADIGSSPGSIGLIDAEDIGGISLSTHNLPATMLIEYLKQFLKCEVWIMGIQPKSLKFGEELSPEVSKTSESLAQMMAGLF